MNQTLFLENISKIHQLFGENEAHLNSLAEGIQNE